MSRFVRSSKYRHVYGTANKRDQCYDNLKVSRNAWDTNLVTANPLFVSINLEASGGMVWRIPEGGLTENISTPVLSLTGHGRKVTLTGHGEIIQSISWNWEGNLLVTTCKDKKTRIFDVRTNTVAQEVNGHQGIKGARGLWMGNLQNIVTTGFSKTSDRQVYIWDSKNLSTPLKQEQIDTASGMLIPYYDGDTSMLYLAGKGDGNIRYYEWSDDDKGLFPLSEYKSSDPLRGIAFLPKRAVATNEVEIARAYKVHPSLVEPISFKVPRKSDAFQSDLYPDTIGPEPTMSAAEWIGGKTCGPTLISLEKGFVAAPTKEFVTSAPGVTAEPSFNAAPTMTDKEYQDAYHTLRRENEDLKGVLAQRDARVRQLEVQIEKLSTEKST
ncbi:hypothetical protein BASA61_010031 [Batrachochytrium salamandrivorans]|nr:hypothetical protein BASA61_010031 [Batrachochytrium salamandrivorans]